MPNLFIYDDPEHWRNRAKEMRVLAEAMANLETKAIMPRIATDYDRLAEHTERRRGQKQD